MISTTITSFPTSRHFLVKYDPIVTVFMRAIVSNTVIDAGVRSPQSLCT